MADRCQSCGTPADPRAAMCNECGAFLDEPPPHPAEAPGPDALGSPRTAPPRWETAAVAQPQLPGVPAVDSAAVPARQTRQMATGARSTPSATTSAGSPLPSDLGPYRRLLNETFGYPDFRQGQASALEALGRGDVLAVMPTGSGKSLCYVLPALVAGRTVVVSPLIALMQDQVEGLEAVGVRATFINSNIDRMEQNRRYRAFIDGEVPLLFVAPERFRNQRFIEGLRKVGVSLLAIDEAHCISEWGHNFRPDYLQLGAVRELLGFPRTLALTATAEPRVRRDIVERLGIAPGASEVVTTVDRPNLTYSVEAIDSLERRRRWVSDYVRARPGLSGIIYVRTRRGVEELAAQLDAEGVAARPYHAGFDRDARSRIQRAFTRGDVNVIVATNAFGMGIDKPDVRYVIHLNMPGRLEAYYQEAGRAGRDGDPAECTLLYARSDRTAQQRFIDEAHPDARTVRETWQRWIQLADRNNGQLPYDLDQTDSEGFAIIVSALRDSGLLDPVALFVKSFDENAHIDVSSIARHRAHAEGRLRDMVEYAETDRCRRAAVLRYFGEEAPDRCEGCDNCLERRDGRSRRRAAQTAGAAVDDDGLDYPDELYEAIDALREQIARQSDREPYTVFENRTARELATYRPRTMDALLNIWGIRETRANWFGRDLLRIIEEWERANPEASEPPPLIPQRRPAQRAADPTTTEAAERVRPDDPLYMALREWRMERARAENAPAFTIFSDRTLRALVAVHPRSHEDLHRVWGLGEARIARLGDDLLEVIQRFDS